MAGEVLKKKREELGLELSQVAGALKLRPEYLDAIENDCFEKLPVAVYTKGYIREYASYLKIEADSIITYYNQHLSHPKPSAVFPVSATRKKTPIAMFLIPVFLLLVGGAVFFFLYQREGGQFVPVTQKVTPPPPQEQAVPAPQPVLPASPPIENVSAPAVPQTPPVPQAPPSGHHLVITAHEKAWVQVKFSDGKTVEMLMHPGDERGWKFAESAVLRTGNAGGIRIKIDEGENIIPGAKGQVLTMTFPRP